MNRYVIVLPEYEETFQDGEQFDSNFEEDSANYIAEDYAEYFHGNRDGWDSSWPLRFDVYSQDGKLIGKFNVNREFRPEFYAEEFKDKKD